MTETVRETWHKYHWAARLEDGSELVQAPLDVSPAFPGKTGWADVLAAGDRVVELSLVSRAVAMRKLNLRSPLTRNEHSWTVDLRTGIFRFDGQPAAVGSNPPTPSVFSFSPVFYRQVELSQDLDARTLGKVGAERRTVRYCLGYSLVDRASGLVVPDMNRPPREDGSRWPCEVLVGWY